MKNVAQFVLFGLGLIGCSHAESPANPQPSCDAGCAKDLASGPALDLSSTKTGSSGEIAVLTYNVAGLPAFISGSSPNTNSAIISPLLNGYDLDLLQEDFAYDKDIMSAVTLPYATPHLDQSGTNLGDGLRTLSDISLDLSKFQRVKWTACNGTFSDKSDCLTDKGFTMVALELGGGYTVDVYDLHNDAGRADADAAARMKQVMQLVDYINTQSPNRPLIVGGDTNMKDTDEAQLQALLTGANLTDVCRAVSCPEPTLHDRVMFRSSTAVTLEAVSWTNDAAKFVDSAGMPLSDHSPIIGRIRWTTH